MSVIMKLVYTISILFLILTGLEIATGNCSTTKSLPNSLGLKQVYTNNNAYLLALPIEGTSLDSGAFTSIRFEPYNTPSLYDESVLFCGNVANFFRNENGTPMHGVVVVVYNRIGHRTFRGLACHDMINVFTMEKQ